VIVTLRVETQQVGFDRGVKTTDLHNQHVLQNNLSQPHVTALASALQGTPAHIQQHRIFHRKKNLSLAANRMWILSI
jgi:hypothetical protein